MQNLSQNVRRLRFALQSPKHKFGLPVGKHVFLYAKCAHRPFFAAKHSFQQRLLLMACRGWFCSSQMGAIVSMTQAPSVHRTCLSGDWSLTS